jgi:hypothetical protein
MRKGTRRVEARFHPPFAANGEYVVVGSIVVGDAASGCGTPRIELSASLTRHQAPAAILSTLRHLIVRCAANPFDGLQALRNRYWSFVPVDSLPQADSLDGIGLGSAD